MAVDPDRPAEAGIAEAADVLRRGGLVAFPTETVYGLGANALDAAAVARIFAAKGRPATDPVIVHVASLAGAAAVVRRVGADAEALAAHFWPGALTLILPKRAEIPAVVTAGLDTVGVRVPSHPVARALLAQARVPIAAPSANIFSGPSPTQAAHVMQDLAGRVDLVLDAGPTPIGVESTIVDLSVEPPVLRRPGGVSMEALCVVVPRLVLATVTGHVDEAQVSPGQLGRHYAPRATLTLYTGSPDKVVRAIGEAARRLAAQGLRVGVLAPEEDVMALAPIVAAAATTGRILPRPFGARRDPDRAAHELFASLRAIDADGVDCILASCPEGTEIGRAIQDRLTRASQGRIVDCRLQIED